MSEIQEFAAAVVAEAKPAKAPAAKVAKTAPVSDISKYRVHLRDLAKAQGWTRTQPKTSVDVFKKGDETITLQWGHILKEAVWTKGTQLVQETKGTQKLKLQRVDLWVQGTKANKENVLFKWNLSPKVKEALEARATKEILWKE